MDDPIRVYWQPGCTSCLRTKEFLQKHGVPFVSRNVLSDAGAFAELARFNLRKVPIVTRGERWVDGQVLADVARLAGIAWGPQAILPPEELGRRLQGILAAARALLARLPEDRLEQQLPNRPRSYAELAFHISNVADAFLEHEGGIALTYDALQRTPAADQQSKAGLLAYADQVRAGIAHWLAASARDCDWTARADVYYGEQTLQQFLERTTWHSGQHVRQLQWVLQTHLGIAASTLLDHALFAALPMPQQVWDAA